MRRIFNIIILGFGLLLVIPSCEKSLLKDDPVSDPFTNFIYLWQQVKNKYSYFEYKKVDWDSIYSVYVEEIDDYMSDQDLFNVLSKMLKELKDGHVNLISDLDKDRNWSWFLAFPDNLNMQNISSYYLGHNYLNIGPFKSQVFDSILYVYHSTFSEEIEEEHIDSIVDLAKGKKGLIIDIRNNGGGSLKNAVTLGSALTDEEYVYGMSRMKTGPGPDDFSPWKILKISPRKGDRYTGKIVLLSNRFAYSTSSYFAQMMKVNPNAILMGDHTGGGGGIPAYGELPNGWIFRLSSSQTMDPEGKHIEGGVKVDYRVNLNPVDDSRGVDTIIETAIHYLWTGTK